MRRLLRRDMLAHLVAERGHVETGEERLAATEEDGRDDEMHLVDEPGVQILPDSGCASAEADVAAARRLLGTGKRGLDAVGDEMEDRAALHFQRRPRMVGEDEDGNVIGRIFAPPASPGLSGHGPRTGPNMFRPMIRHRCSQIPLRQSHHRSRSCPVRAEQLR